MTRNHSFAGWTWSAVFVGTITALIFQLLLVMAGYGAGLLSIDVPTADSAPTAVSWAVYCWWAVSGVISAFAAGWVAANFSETFVAETRAAHGLVAWALATLIVFAVAGFTVSNSLAGNLVGPTGTVIAQYRTLMEPRTGVTAVRPTQAQLDAARRNLALAMIGSFVALVVGAGAAVAGSQWLPETGTRASSARRT